MQDQAFLGPEAALAIPDATGGVDIHAASQWLHGDRDAIAPCLGLDPERVRFHLAGVGGAFGGREDLSVQLHSALLALKTGRPVRFVYGREELFQRPSASASGARMGRAPRRPRGESRARARPDPARRRRVHVQLPDGARERCGLLLRPLPDSERRDRGRLRLHQQSAGRGDAQGTGPCRAASRARRRWTSSRPALDSRPRRAQTPHTHWSRAS